MNHYTQSSCRALINAYWSVNLTLWKGKGCPDQADLEIIIEGKPKKKFKSENIMGRGNQVASRVRRFLVRNCPDQAADRMEQILNFMQREMNEDEEDSCDKPNCFCGN